MSKFVFFPSLVNNILRCKSLSHPLKPKLLLAEHIHLLNCQLHPPPDEAKQVQKRTPNVVEAAGTRNWRPSSWQIKDTVVLGTIWMFNDLRSSE